MRAAARLLASVQNGSSFLQPGAPTGLTGLFTHPSPRSTLLYLYSSTLEKLKEFPESSVYRKSTEALTKHRMKIVEEIKPAGLSEWQSRVRELVEKHPEAIRKIPTISGGTDFNIIWKQGVLPTLTASKDEGANFKTAASVEASRAELTKLKKGIRGHTGLLNNVRPAEGPGPRKQKEIMAQQMSFDAVEEQSRTINIEQEPSLTADQINEIETKIGAGLIEEVIQVAEGEKELVETLYESKVWEDLEEKPSADQWTYHERDTHTPETQAP